MTAVGGATPREAPHVTPAMEDYLKAAYRLGDGAGPVTTHRLAAALGVSCPSDTNMVKRLQEQGLVRHVPYHGLELTGTGEQVALRVVRHHRLLELYLVESLGYGWDEVHAEAERLEHHVSEAMEVRINAALGHPTRDPHGHPIPSGDGTLPAAPDRCLLDLDPGDRAVITRVSDRDPARLRSLGGPGLYPGVAVTVLAKPSPEGLLRIGVGNAEHLVGPALAAAVHVTGHPSAA